MNDKKERSNKELNILLNRVINAGLTAIYSEIQASGLDDNESPLKWALAEQATKAIGEFNLEAVEKGEESD